MWMLTYQAGFIKTGLKHPEKCVLCNRNCTHWITVIHFFNLIFN